MMNTIGTLVERCRGRSFRVAVCTPLLAACLVAAALTAGGGAFAQDPNQDPAAQTAPQSKPVPDAAEDVVDRMLSPEGAGQTGAAAPGAAEKPTGQAAIQDQGIPWYYLAIIVVAVIVVPFWVGSLIGSSLRMPDHGWKIGLVLCSLAAAAVIVGFGQIKLGPDLSGGINLIYEVDPAVEEVEVDKLIAALSRRINPGGVKEVTIRPYGARQIEIIIPKADDAEVDQVKRSIVTAGALEFRITANENDHRNEIARAKESPALDVKIGDDLVARWVKLDMTQFGPQEIAGFVTRENLAGRLEVLVAIDRYNVTGEYLQSATAGMDQTGRPAVNFTFNATGADLFAKMTTEYGPIAATGFKRNLGIVLDNTLLSAPSLNEPITGGRGQISGGNFTDEEVNFLISILNAGSLPAALSKTPISEQVTSPTLGSDTIRMGTNSMIVSMSAVVLFMLAYYRFSGVVACLALAANLLLLLAIMISIKAAFTLPGIAGLVLTIGMAVDANVLIFERIREELGRGAALRMAIRNGFSRATRTIIDANVTTLITAVVLYVIGTDQIKGFAVTLILGILMSMFTAIFCARIVFDVAEKKKWITELKMMRFFGGTIIDFLGKRRLAIGASLIVIALGIGGVVARGKNLLDIDFTGGSSVTLAFKEPQDVAEVRQQVAELPDVAVYGVGEDKLLYKVDTSIRDFEEVQNTLRQIFGGKLRTNHMEYDVSALANAKLSPSDSDRALLPDENVLALADAGEIALLQEEQPAEPPVTEEEATEEEDTEDEPARDESAEQPAGDEPGQPAEEKEADQPPGQPTQPQKISAELTFSEPIKHDSLQTVIENAFAPTGVAQVPFELNHPEYTPGSDLAVNTWKLEIPLDPEKLDLVLQHVKSEVSGEPVFPSASNIGGKVAGDTQAKAGYALFASLLFIVGYIWLRFQHLMFGLAAVVALVHDVLITLGVVALSYYLVTFAEPAAALMLIEPFKISLPLVAAFMTIIGYSLNDTIVVFDRIREVRGKSPDLTAEMINVSINQTLSRTLLTSLTTLIVAAILYVAGGPGIHSFAFALVVGVTVGTYSSIFIASPVLLWMSRTSNAKNGPRASERA